MAEKNVSCLQERVRTARTFFQLLGGLVSVLFALQGVVIYISLQDVPDFWEATHWIGAGTLYVAVGAGVCFLEARAYFMPGVLTNFLRNAKYRLGLGVIYIWIGAYSMGGRISERGEGWQTLGQVTGMIAWVVGVANILISCFFEHAEEDEGAPASAEHGKGKHNEVSPEPDAEAGEASEEGAGGAAAIGRPSEGLKASPTAASGGAPSPAANAVEEPAGGWNTYGARPFGS